MSEELDYSRSFTLETIESNLTEKFNNIVFSSPAGTGKTKSAREYILKHYMEGIIYVAQTKSVLDEMENFLIENGIPRKDIANFHSSSQFYKDFKAKAQLEINAGISEAKLYEDVFKYKSIILVTHSRLLYDAPNKYLYVTNFGSLERVPNIRTMIIDEAINPSIIATMNLLVVENRWDKILGSNLYDWEGIPDIESNETKIREMTIQIFNTFIERKIPLSGKTNEYRILYPEEWQIRINDGTSKDDEYNTEKQKEMRDNKYSDTLKDKICNIYIEIAKQIVLGNYFINDTTITLIIPLALQQVWYKMVRNLLILDATGEITPFFYQGYKFISLTNWNFEKLDIQYPETQEFYNKTRLVELAGRNSKELYDQLDILTSTVHKHNKVYVVTFKALLPFVLSYLQNKFPDYVIELDDTMNNSEKVIYLMNYGKTRGSNNFRDTTLNIQVGSYRLNPDFINLLSKLYDGVNAIDISYANYLQELYRSCIRKNEEIESRFICDSENFNKINYFLKEYINNYSSLEEFKSILEEGTSEDSTYYKRIIYNWFKVRGPNDKLEVSYFRDKVEKADRKFDFRDFKRAFQDIIVTKPIIHRLFNNEDVAKLINRLHNDKELEVENYIKVLK